MTLKALYDNMAATYNTANRFGAISQSHMAAIAQINEQHVGMRPHCKVLDLGVGNGAFLRELKKTMPDADFTGIDLSKEMLQRAAKALPLVTIEDTAAAAHNYLPPHSQDLILAHFVNAYIPIDTLFHEASLLTRANGHFSLITTTYEAFPLAQRHLADFIAQDTLMSSVVGHYYKSILKNTTVAAGKKELLGAFAKHEFDILSHERISIPITLQNIDELAEFGIEGTWFLNSLSIRMLPKNFLLQRLKRLFSKIFTFPYHDTHVIDIILAKK